jgi:sulfur-oxidizing protein SoxA
MSRHPARRGRARVGNKPILWLGVLVLLGCATPSLAGPEEDREAFVRFFSGRFPDIPFAEYANGIYAIDDDARAQWQAIEEFPPYEFAIESGESAWRAGPGNGGDYSRCFGEELAAIRGRYPRYDPELGAVETLSTAINRCRTELGARPLPYDSEEMIALTAYLAFAARGQPVQVMVPADQPGALAAYESGKRFYYSKRGQLNFACSDCHVTSVGQYVRADRLSASLGHPTHFPVYRSKLGGMISLHQRFSGCVRDVGAQPFELQSEPFRNLEYFLTYMSNGLEINGPGARK